MTRGEMDDVFFEMKKLVVDCKISKISKDEALAYLNLAYSKAENKISRFSIVWGSDEADELARSWADRIPTVEELSEKLAAVYHDFKKQVDALPETGQKAADCVADGEYLKRLADTGYIMINPRTKDRTVYLVKKGHSALDVFNELTKMTGSELRTRSIMLQNMTGVEITLNTHRPKHTLKT